MVRQLSDSDITGGINKVQSGTDAASRIRALLGSDPRAALEEAQAAIRAGPDAVLLRLAAEAHRRLGQVREAELAELAGIKVSFDNPALRSAAVGQQEGRSDDAKRIADTVLQEHPDDLLALTVAGEAAISRREFAEADNNFQHVLDRAPGFLRASLLFATSLKTQARVREAINLLRDGVLKRDPANAPALTMIAECLAELNDLTEAVETYRRLLDIDPGQPRTWIIYAQHLRILGRRDESKAAFRKALALDQAQSAAWWGLAQFFPETLTANDVAAMEQAIELKPGSADGEAPARIALSLIEDRKGDYRKAFEHLSRGKQLRLQAQPYDPAKISADVDDAIRYFPQHLFNTRVGSDATSPIFVVGMPRSGSTLIERILGQHPDIESAGELPLMPKIIDQLRFDQGKSRSYAEFVSQLDAEQLAEIGDTYVERARDYRHTDRAKFIDKFNLNWLHSGLLNLILPNSRIIDVRRNALDCCWSNFKMLFADGHANDLQHIGRLYRDYVRLMDHVDSVRPNAVLRIRYEDLVTDLEAETRKMLDYIGVRFEPTCVYFHLSDAPVATPSSEQVRKPLFRTAIGSSEPYKQWLGELIDELGPLADT